MMPSADRALRRHAGDCLHRSAHPVDGMFLCGASTRAGHGVLGSMSSGLAAAKRVARSMGKPLPVDEKR